MPPSRALFFVIAFFCAELCYAASEDIDAQQLAALAQDPQWLALLHYQRIGLFSSAGSQVDDRDFFLSPTGQQNPRDELKATLEFLSAPASSDNTHARCRFPARLHWLQSQLPHFKPTDSPCSAYQQWIHEIDAASLTLIFPAAYLNSPSSMFGHTFIRINRNKSGNPLLDYSVNFAAEANPSEDQFSYAFKGLSGGYAGQFSVMPYYQKVNEYSFLESRDVWEYPMQLSHDEVEQFVRHIWELRDIDFDYYFFTENCSYQLLTALDAANASWRLSQDFRIQAIPVDTVRSLSQRNLLGAPVFRPSSLSRLRHWQAQLTQSELEEVSVLMNPSRPLDTNSTASSPERRALILEYTYHLLRYLAVKEKLRAPEYNQRAIALLSARSKLGKRAGFSDYPHPAYSDEQGHGSHRVGVHYGRFDDQHGVELGLRPAYHDLLDPLAGFISGAELEMFSLELRYLTERQHLQLQDLTFINILSLSESTQHISPLSWGVRAALERARFGAQRTHGILTGSVGKSYRAGTWLMSGLWDAELGIKEHNAPFIRAYSGPKLEVSRQTNQYSLQLSGKHLRRIDKFQDYRAGLSVGGTWHISNNYQMRIEFEHWHHEHERQHDHFSELKVGTHVYF